MTPERPPVAVLGGTFDPVHNGHIALAMAVRDAIGAEQAWLIPAHAPALRPEPEVTAPIRLAMAEAAVRDLRGMHVMDTELRRGGVSHTLDTLEAIEAARPELQAWWILGADAVRHIGSWHRSDELRAVIHLVVVQRACAAHFDEAEADSLGLDPARTRVLDLTPPPVSATDVRRRILAGEPIDGLVPPAVAGIIAARGLYRSDRGAIMDVG